MEIKCKFETVGWAIDSYSCHVVSASITKPGTTIKFYGIHEEGRSNEDVEAIFFLNTQVKYFPRGLNLVFPRLKHLEIINCGLLELSRDDLAGLEDIEKLYLDCNQLKILPENLFKGMRNLKQVSFNNNKLEFVSSNMLRPLLENYVIYVNFLNNPRINSVYGSEWGWIFDLMDQIDKYCLKPIAAEA
jgi:hypothetical protein